MGKQNIWPAKAGGKLIQVDESTYKFVKEEIRKRALFPATTDDLWEFTRMVLEKERAAREKEERRSHGDWEPELLEIDGFISDLIYRTDGDTYERLTVLRSKVTEMRQGGFLAQDAEALAALHQELTGELHKSDEIAVKMGRVISEMKEGMP